MIWFEKYYNTCIMQVNWRWWNQVCIICQGDMLLKESYSKRRTLRYMTPTLHFIDIILYRKETYFSLSHYLMMAITTNMFICFLFYFTATVIITCITPISTCFLLYKLWEFCFRAWTNFLLYLLCFSLFPKSMIPA